MKNFIRQQLFPGFSAIKANRIIQKQYSEQVNSEVELSEEFQDTEALKYDLENLIKQQLQHKEKLEDKAKSLLFIITLAITTAIFSLSFLKDTPDGVFSPVLALLSICCFVFAGVRIISAINIRKFHVNDIVRVIYERTDNDQQQTGKFLLAKDEPTEYVKSLAKSKGLNELICIKIANLTYASFILIRNGIILFALFFAISVVLIFSGEKLSSQNADMETNSPQKNELAKKDSILIKQNELKPDSLVGAIP